MDYIVKTIDRYIRRKNTNYAILINGKWGSGKTYFWENILKSEIENIVVDGRNMKTNYVSLYGITNLDEINRRIVLDNLLKKSPMVQTLVGGKLGGKLTELAKMGFSVVKSLELPVLKQVFETEVNYENLLDFTDTILCFDDLERANLELTDILGYINNFVEHDGVKVIIISNEDEISEKLISRNLELKMLVSTIVAEKEGLFNQSQLAPRDTKEKMPTSKLISDRLISLFDKSNEYKRIKEKLVGKTLTLIPDYPNLIEQLISNTFNQEIKDFLKENLELINYIFKNSGTENIRILKQGFEDFELIYDQIQRSAYQINDDVIASILKFTLAASFEIKSGAEGNEVLESVKTNDDFISTITLARMMKNKEKNYLELFKEKYYGSFNVYNAFIFFKFAELLVRKGVFSEVVFKQEMSSISEKSVDNTPLDIKFLRDGYWDLTDEEFFESEKYTYEKLVNGEVPFVMYFRAFTLYRHLLEKGLIQKNIKELKIELLEGLKKAGERSIYYEAMDTHFIGIEIKSDDSDVIEFKERILGINGELREKKQREEVHSLMERLDSDFHQFLVDMQEKYFYVPVFNQYNSGELLVKIISLSNSNTLTFSQLIEKRYRDLNDALKLYVELDNLKNLKNEIEDYINGKNITPKISLLKDLSETIQNILNRLELEISKQADETFKKDIKGEQEGE